MKLKVWPKFQIEHGIIESKLDSLDSVTDVMNNKLLDRKEDYVFRGHRRNDWQLEPTLTRHLKNNDILSVQEQLDFFRKSIKGRRGINPSGLNDKECWALGQTFGLYTPLLDWTDSPYVGLFFAFAEEGKADDRTETRILFALNRKRIVKERGQISS